MRAIKADHCGDRGHGPLLQEIRPTASLDHETDQHPTCRSAPCAR
jgi:hypothetical protein